LPDGYNPSGNLRREDIMKKFFVLLVALAACAVLALDDIALPTDGSLYEGPVHSAARAALAVTLRAEMAAQVDTNTTTTVTLYTPRRVGDILIGQDGAGTNLVAISKGVTTNDWVNIKP
jgi:hypothetical protein